MSKSKKNNALAIVWEWTESIVIALVLAIVIRAYFIQPFKIPSGSMHPTLTEDNEYNFLGRKFVIGDHLFVNKLVYGPILLPELHSPEFLQDKVDLRWPHFLDPLSKVRLPGYSRPQRGDVVVFVYPKDRTKDFIKRLVGLPGDIIEIKDGYVYINGKKSDNPKLQRYYYNQGEYGVAGQPVKVPEGKYFMMGDNSGASADSRYWGFVDQYDIIGKAELIFWPLDRIRFIQ